MFKFKKIVSLFLALVLTLGTASSAFAVDDRVSFGNMEISGVGMTPTEFEDAFATSVKSTINPADYAAATLNLTGIIYSGDELTMNATLTTADNTAVEFEFGGKLYDGYKQEMFGADSFIVDAESSNAEVQSLLFEVVTNNQDTDALIDTTLSGVANIKVYVKYNGLVYMFEGAIPTGFSVVANGEYEKMTDPLKDMLWFASVTAPSITIENTDISDVPSVFAIKERTWTGKTYNITMDINGKEYVQTAIPFGYIEYADTINNSDHTWKAGFFISVHTRRDDYEVTTDVDSIINFKNVAIGFRCGSDTEICRVHTDGRVAVNNNPNASSTLNLIGSSIPKAGPFVSAISFFRDVITYGNPISVKLGSTSLTVLPKKTCNASISIPSDSRMFNNSFDATSGDNTTVDSPAHYLLYDATVRSTLSSGSVSTVGTIYFKWDVIRWSTFETIDSDATSYVSFTYTARG